MMGNDGWWGLVGWIDKEIEKKGCGKGQGALLMARGIGAFNQTNLEEWKEQSNGFNFELMLWSIGIKWKRKGSYRLQVIGSQEVKIICCSFLW